MESHHRGQVSFVHIQKHSSKILTRIMDIGCGTGRVSALLEKAGYDVFSFDLVFEMIRYSRTRRVLDAVVADARKILVRNESVELAFSLLLTLNHFGNSEDFLNHFREVHRVLRRNSVYVADMVIEQPPCNGECESWEINLDRKRYVFKYIVEESSDRYYINVFMIICGKKKIYESRMRTFLPTFSSITDLARRAGFNDILYYKPFSFDKCSMGRCFAVFIKSDRHTNENGYGITLSPGTLRKSLSNDANGTSSFRAIAA